MSDRKYIPPPAWYYKVIWQRGTYWENIPCTVGKTYPFCYSYRLEHHNDIQYQSGRMTIVSMNNPKYQ